MIFNCKSETVFFFIMETNIEDFVSKCIFFDKYDPIFSLGLATCMHFELLFSLFIRMSRDLLINKMRKSNYQKIQQIQKLNPVHCWKNLARKRRKNQLSERAENVHGKSLW